MKAVVDSYIGIWLIILFLMLCIAFTSINLNVTQARKMYNDIKAQVQASNGLFVDDTDVFSYSSASQTGGNARTLSTFGYEYNYTITRRQLEADKSVVADNETWIYNDIYLIDFRYRYTVPLFGVQEYPIVGYSY